MWADLTINNAAVVKVLAMTGYCGDFYLRHGEEVRSQREELRKEEKCNQTGLIFLPLSARG
jgi:hypothetical protein